MALSFNSLQWSHRDTSSLCQVITGVYSMRLDKHEWVLRYSCDGKSSGVPIGRYLNRSQAADVAQDIHNRTLEAFVSEAPNVRDLPDEFEKWWHASDYPKSGGSVSMTYSARKQLAWDAFFASSVPEKQEN